MMASKLNERIGWSTILRVGFAVVALARSIQYRERSGLASTRIALAAVAFTPQHRCE
jgi:hypothetical protein